MSIRKSSNDGNTSDIMSNLGVFGFWNLWVLEIFVPNSISESFAGEGEEDLDLKRDKDRVMERIGNHLKLNLLGSVS